MIKNVAYGKEKEWYVQLVCAEEHMGQECACQTISENLTENEAKQLGEELAKQYNVELQKWRCNNE